MKRRVVIVLLWFYAAWYAAAMVAGTLGYPEPIGPIAGAIVATLVTIRLRRVPKTTPEMQQGVGGSASPANPVGTAN